MANLLHFTNEEIFDEQQLRDVERLYKNTDMTLEQVLSALQVESWKVNDIWKNIYGEEQRIFGKRLTQVEAIRRAKDQKIAADVFDVTQEQLERITKDIADRMDDVAIVRDVDWGDNSFKKITSGPGV